MRLFNRGRLPKYHKFVWGDATWQLLSDSNKRKACAGKVWYYLDEKIVWLDKKTGKTVTVPAGYISDGASGAIDIKSKGWWVHDWLCEENGFDDGTPCSNWTASRILSNILWSEKRIFRSSYWRWSTFLFGGKDLSRF